MGGTIAWARLVLVACEACDGYPPGVPGAVMDGSVRRRVGRDMRPQLSRADFAARWWQGAGVGSSGEVAARKASRGVDVIGEDAGPDAGVLGHDSLHVVSGGVEDADAGDAAVV